MSEELIRLREIESAARDVFAYPAGSPRDVWNRLAVALGETALHADCGVCDEQSRRAEIGFLIEELSGTNVRVSIPPNTSGAAILDALRALKKEEWSQ